MSAEQSVPEAVSERQMVSGAEQTNGSGGFELDENGQRVSHGLGQSKSSRRRRRKRKGKGSEASDASPENNHPPVEVMPGEVIGGLQAASASTQQQPRPARPQFNGQPGNQQANGFQQNASTPGGTKRWKKKFRERDRQRPGGDNAGNVAGGGFAQQSNGASQGGFRGPDTHQPGNGGGFKRKAGFSGGGGKQQRQGGSRGGFVGPMDHSYRPVNGNVFDPGGESHSNHGGGRNGRYQSDSQPIDYSQGRAIPIAEGAPTRIYFFIEDLFFTAKIQETARKLGVKVAFVKNEKEQLTALTSGDEETRPALIVFDLNNSNAKPMTLIPKLRTKLKKTASIIGFLSHLQGDLKAKAVEAGCDTVMPRAAFSQNLPNLLRRYGVEETDETNYNQ